MFSTPLVKFTIYTETTIVCIYKGIAVHVGEMQTFKALECLSSVVVIVYSVFFQTGLWTVAVV